MNDMTMAEWLAVYIEAGGGRADIFTALAIYEAEASTAIDNDERAHTYAIDTPKDKTP